MPLEHRNILVAGVLVWILNVPKSSGVEGVDVKAAACRDGAVEK